MKRNISNEQTNAFLELANSIMNPKAKPMQMFSIARERQIPNQGYDKQICFLRLEPNGNVFWTIHPELASRWEHAEAEQKLVLYMFDTGYLVAATKEDA